MRSKKMLPPTYLYLAIGMMVSLHYLFPAAAVIQKPWTYLGILPFIGGFVLNMMADRAFKRQQTTVKPFEESTTLVMNGVYHISRNPMYLGFVLVLGGIAIFMGSLTPFAVIILFPLVMDKVFINVEESMLEEKFGSSWTDYRQNVRRWI